MLKCHLYLLFWTELALAIIISHAPVNAQVTPDNSLGTQSSIVNPNVTVKDAVAELISGGAVRGNNLFHSFGEFNVGDGARVYFANPDGVANILTRVTGSNLSQINGTLGVEGGANLFILNPNGIVFGENAALDINGSFLATTGDSYRFSNGFEYSATNPETPSLLTVNLPVGVQMGQQPGKISVQDSGHGIIKQRDTDPFINFDNFNGLRVKPNQTLSLIGGGIDLVGGNLIASEGTIQLGSIAQGRVNLNIAQQSPWLLDYQEAEKYQDINLSQKALVDVSGVNTGFIQIHGANITLKDGSVISNNNFQTSNSQGEIIVKAEDNLVVTGVDENSLTRSAIAANALGSQQGAAINVNSKKLLVTDGGFIGAVSYNSGRGGDVSIKVDDSLVINGFAIANSIFPSTILTVNFASGDAGNLTFDTKSMEILAGGTINSTVLGTGQGGDILVNAAESITIKDIDFDSFLPSVISSVNFNQGDAGDVTINTGELKLEDGGRVDSVSFAQGNAGSLIINASKSVEVTGTVPNSINPSLITSAASTVDPIIQKTFNLPPQPSGDAGNLTINTPQVTLQ